MLRRRRLIYNTALLTVSSLLMSCIGMAFQVWLVGRIGRHRTLSARPLGHKSACDLCHLRHPLCLDAPCLRGAGARKPRRHPLRDAPLPWLRVVFRCGGGRDNVAFSGTDRLSLDRRCAHSYVAQALGDKHALHLTVLVRVRVLHRLRPRLEADACPFCRAAFGHRPRRGVPERRPRRGH